MYQKTPMAPANETIPPLSKDGARIYIGVQNLELEIPHIHMVVELFKFSL